ncbi:hypothetical protein Spirs_1086 [Sediminispirochaeta smaragdinae DSM 11293]|uniref:Uncharacterized protein n=1 Tax=Sediminispirochaeta smaragdinae (strain DSM 11293 / JCM 15392 / SEBR 4228) TaxID=573413 RepID=E1R0W9_SEDSS|nr:hypothetical protein Spirs_1086 [Sediminispirochaeta smaragdinae DSM 11293]
MYFRNKDKKSQELVLPGPKPIVNWLCPIHENRTL